MLNHHSLPKPIWLLVTAIIFSFCLNAQTAPPQPAAYNQKLQTSSLLFMENKGQVADAKGNLRPDVLFTANSAGAKLYLSANAIYYQFTKTEYPKGFDPHKREPTKDLAKEAELQKQIKSSTHRFSLELQSANLHPTVTTEKQSAYTENYYLAHCPDGVTDVHGYEKITYKNVYPNIDWVIYSKGGFMEYDFLVHPGANPSNIKLKVKDAESASITAAGELVMKTSLGEVREKAPVSYADGKETESHFKQLGDGTIGFDVQPQPGKELRIDPSVVWATYYGGTGFDKGHSVAVDNSSNCFMAGYTASTNGIAAGGFQNTTTSGQLNAFLAKFDSTGNRLWATYYGGESTDYGYSVAVDMSGNAYMAGETQSSGIASGGFQNVYAGGLSDAFLVKFAANGTRMWATYYGGDDEDIGYYVVVDSTDYVYLSGTTQSLSGIAAQGFKNSYSGNHDAFLIKLTSSGNRVWATYYGDIFTENGYGCAVDKNRNVYLSGYTQSTQGIASNGFQTTFGGTLDAFLVKFDSSGNRLWATYYGGSGYEGALGKQSIAIDGLNNVYLTGETESTSGVAFGGFKNNLDGYYDAFLVKFSSSGARLWATYYGGSYYDIGYSIIADAANNIYLCGETDSPTSIASGGFQNSASGGMNDAFLVKFNSGGSRLWATYYGGTGDEAAYDNIQLALDKTGNVYMAGGTNSATGIAYNGFQNSKSTGFDAFLAKVKGNGGEPIILSGCLNSMQTLTSDIMGPSYQWQVNTGSNFTNLTDNANYSGTNSKTLHLNNLPGNWYGYQYRCLVNGNFSKAFLLSFTNTWSGSINSAWENPTNWSCGILPDGNTDVIINTGSVTLNSNGICRTLTVKPGASFTVAVGNTLTITH